MSIANVGQALDRSRFWAAILVAATLVVAIAAASAAFAEEREGLDCTIHFQLSGWSPIYERVDGSGIVACSDDTAMPVFVRAPAAGFTVGKMTITNGSGRFAHVRQISDIFGTYAQGDVHASVAKSGETGLLTNGMVSLELAFKGEGDHLVVGMAGFTIRPQ